VTNDKLIQVKDLKKYYKGERIKALDGGIPCRYETGLAAKLSALTDAIAEKTDALDKAVREAGDPTDVIATSAYIKDTVLPAMEALRAVCDEAETVTAKDFWPFPSYAELLFGV
jgi:glutamine synthetase